MSVVSITDINALSIISMNWSKLVYVEYTIKSVRSVKTIITVKTLKTVLTQEQFVKTFWHLVFSWMVTEGKDKDCVTKMMDNRIENNSNQ